MIDENKITFTTQGGDGNEWALDQTLLCVKKNLISATNWRFVNSITFSNIVIFGWYSGYLELKHLITKNKLVICLLDNDSEKVYPEIFLSRDAKRVDIWLTHSSREKEKLRSHNMNAFIMPNYIKDKSNSSKNINEEDFQKYLYPLISFKKQNPGSKIIISIQRDSSFINGDWLPKEQKNPKYLLDLYKRAYCLKNPYILALTGARRHWLVRELEALDLPYIYLGDKPSKEDDYLKKVPRDIILRIIKECDFSIVTSSWEGGPLSISESLEVGRLCFSTEVGLANDILSKKLLLTGNLNEDISLIQNLIEKKIVFDNAYNETFKKYNHFVNIDLSIFIQYILNNLKYKNSNIFIILLMGLIPLDFCFSKIELIIMKMIRRIKTNYLLGKILKKIFSIF